MPELPLVQVIVLTLIVVAFAAFGLILLGVSVYVSGGREPTSAETIEREVIPAKRAGSPH